MVAFCINKRFSFEELGITNIHLKESVIINGIFSILTVAALLIAYNKDLIRKPTVPDYSFFFYFYIILSCPLQEFLYRSIIYCQLKRSGRNFKYFIFISAINYSFLHIFYHDVTTIVSSFVAGIIWGVIYKKYPNFWGVALSHACIGATAIFVGLI